MKICLATNNPHKVEEINSLLTEGIQLLTLKDINCHQELPENQNTLEGNSLEKAEYIFHHYNINSLADDTGLEVFSLDGAPGVYSARFAGDHKNNEDNIDLLLDKLKTQSNRTAQFRTIITLIIEKKVLQFEGIVKGDIILERRGTNGFGYDSVFIPVGKNKTFAEMNMDEKNEISHRGIAIRKLVEYLNNIDHTKS